MTAYSMTPQLNLKKKAFLSGLSMGLRAPTVKGGQLIIIHIGSEDGFVNGALELFKVKKKEGDYHGEMNGPHYEEWFTNKFLPNIQLGSIIVMDNAPYHSVHVEKIPTSSTKKEKKQAFKHG